MKITLSSAKFLCELPEFKQIGYNDHVNEYRIPLIS
jgi:hypothetical protein